VRKKHLAGAAVGVLALVFAAVAIASPQFKQTAAIKYSSNKGKKLAGIIADIEASDPGANPPGAQPGATKVVINLKGAKTDTKAGKQCKKPKLQAASCPAKTRIDVPGSGSAKANIVGTTPSGQVIATQDVFGGFNIKAYLAKNAIYFVITSKTPGGPTTILKSSFKHGKLTANVAKDTAGTIPAPNKIVLTSFKIKIKKVSSGHGKHKRLLIRTPKCGKSKHFTITSKFNYDDGTSKSVTSKQKCRK